MLVTTIFNNLYLPKNDPHYKKKIIIRDLTELFILYNTYALVLVYNYLQFLGIKMRKTLILSIFTGCVFISNIILNRKTLFGSNIELL